MSVMDQSKRVSERGSWGKWSEYLLAYLGCLVGYGNMWRFPYVCYRNGGGAFLLPFILAIFIIGMPLTFLETLYSQYSNCGPGRVWEVCPLFKGIGLCMMILMFINNTYYVVITAWTLFYLGNSFRDPIPWAHCDNPWNSANCTPASSEPVTRASTLTNNSTNDQNATLIGSDNITKISSAEEFWFKEALGISAGIDEIGELQWPLVLCLLAAWTVTLLCLVRGIHSLGKVAYVAATLPYLILICLFIRGCLLPGSGDGLYFLFVPRWEQLASLTVWRDAASQIFYSVGLGLGAIATLASYNKFHNNCYRDALIMPLLDSLSSIFAAMVIFAYLGYAAYLTGKGLESVVAQGPGLVFMVYPSALATLPLPQLWSVLFFCMLFTVGLDSQVVNVETIATAVIDCFPRLLPWKLGVTAIICGASFLFGLPFVAQSGQYILNLIDWYLASVPMLLISFIECVVLAWIYGTDRMYSDVQHMIGYRPPMLFKYAWKFVTPGLILFLWISGFAVFQPISAKMDGFSLAADFVGLAIAVVPLFAVPVTCVWVFLHMHGPWRLRLSKSLKPSPKWGPALEKATSTLSSTDDPLDLDVCDQQLGVTEKFV